MAFITKDNLHKASPSIEEKVEYPDQYPTWWSYSFAPEQYTQEKKWGKEKKWYDGSKGGKKRRNRRY